jgi:predicted ribosome quality control (RQC) complex YloA/Tae2 family protein
LRGDDAAETAAIFHEALDLAAGRRDRARGLAALIESEIRRLRRAQEGVASDLATFADPERHRLQGEALLAGLARARRAGDRVIVPDPYDESGPPVVVPAPAGASLPAVAETCFERYRRARRGHATAGERQASLSRRLLVLERLAASAAGGRAAPCELEAAMREAGIPVGLPARGAGRALREPVGPRVRLEGVRLFRTADGLSAMIGKTARDNDRLTFRLAGPEDFWFHALRVTGAHVVVRNDERSSAPPPRSLHEAAAAAAWYSEARGDDGVDVQWTRRKYVRRVRGGGPGRVVVKRFATVRVRPRAPGAAEDAR